MPFRKRAAYLPRTPPRSSDRSYSRRKWPLDSSRSAFFFIVVLLAARRFARANDSYCITVVSVRDDEDSIAARKSNCNKPLFKHGVIRVRIRQGQRVAEDSGSFLE